MWLNGCDKTPVTNVVSPHDPVLMSVGQLPGVGLSPGANTRTVRVSSDHSGYVSQASVFDKIARQAPKNPHAESDTKSVTHLGYQGAVNALARGQAKMGQYNESAVNHLI